MLVYLLGVIAGWFSRAALKTNPAIRVKFMLQDKTGRNPAFVISASFEQDVYMRLKDELWIAYKGPVNAHALALHKTSETSGLTQPLHRRFRRF